MSASLHPTKPRQAPRRLLYGLGVVAGLWACGAAGTVIDGYSTTPNGPAGVQFVPGPHQALAQVTSRGGQTMHNPVLQIISFNGDPQAPQYEAFIAALVHSSYWQATTAEYGIGAATAAKPARLSLPAGNGLTDGSLAGGEHSDVEVFLTAQLDDAAQPLGAASQDTLYVLFMPPDAAVSLDSNAPAQACANGVVAWHTAMRLTGAQLSVPYVVVPDCGLAERYSAIDSRTIAASHAIIAAVTDPFLDAYGALDANHIALSVPAAGTNVAAVCLASHSGDANVFIKPADLGFFVQRTWSNAQATAGHAPCVPAPQPQQEAFFASVPVLTQTVRVPLGTSLLDPNLSTAGVVLPPQTTATVAVQLFSDAATPTPWRVEASEVGTDQLSLSTDRATGTNGDTLTLTLVAQPWANGFSLVQLASSLANRRHSQYIIVAHDADALAAP